MGAGLMPHSPWRVAMASSIGASHVAAAQPCQDAHFPVEATGPDGERTMVLALSDGAGTAALAEGGVALACGTFGCRVETIGRPLVAHRIAGVVYRLELPARETGAALEDQACTLLAAAAAEREAVFLQIGDGGIVLSVGEGWKRVFWPLHGEFANTTNFITSAHRLAALEFETSSAPVNDRTDDDKTLVLASRRPS
jgi:hypothetical protein